MRTALVLGAGQSSPYLIHHLLEHAQELEIEVVVADRDPAAAADRVAGHSRGRSLALDILVDSQRRPLIEAADLVVHLLPPPFQPLVAGDCLAAGRPMVSASYRHAETHQLDAEARRQGVLLLTEVGLDPGIDLMTARAIIQQVEDEGGVVDSFVSYGGGLPAPEVDSNPLRYCITWNARNVVMAARDGAEYLHNDRLHAVPWHRVFDTTWPVEIPGLGQFDAYPNRDSVSYRATLGLEDSRTLIRGTLRWPGFCQLWHQIVQLGLPNEVMEISDLGQRTFAELTEMFGPHTAKGSLEERTAKLLGLAADSPVLEQLRWLGLFDDEVIGGEVRRPAEALVRLLSQRLPLPPGGRDLVVLYHQLQVRYPQQGDRRECLDSTFINLGQPDGFTAMATTVGLPAAVAGRFILDGTLGVTGSRIPTAAEIYRPILAELERHGLQVQERRLATPC